MNDKSKIPTLILPSSQAQLVSTVGVDSLIYPKRLKAGQYIVSDGTIQYGIITIASTPQRIRNDNNNDYANARTLYRHKHTFVKTDAEQTNPNIQSNIDSLEYPIEIYIIRNKNTVNDRDV